MTTTITSALTLPDGTTPTSGTASFILVGTGGHPVTAYVTATGATVVGKATATAASPSVELFSNDAITPSGTRWKRVVKGANLREFVDFGYVQISTPDPSTWMSVLTDAPGTVASSALAVVQANLEAADDALDARIDTVDGDLADEATARAAADGLKVDKATLTTDGDVLTRAAGVPARITRAALAADSAFSGTYVAHLGPSNGTDDTAVIAAAVANGTGVRKTVIAKPGETYIVAAGQIVIGSKTTLDLSGATLRRKTGSTGNLITNTAYGTQRTVTDAAITSGLQVLTSATAAFTAGDVGKNFTLTKASAVGGSISGTITGYTNSTTVTVSVAAGTTTTNGVLCIYGARDTDIAIIGDGSTLIDGGANAAGTTLGLHHLLFRHVDGLTIKGFRAESVTSGKYMVAVGDCTRFLVADIDGDVYSDLVHVQGPASDFTIRNIRGKSGDDFVALIPNDYANYNDVAGDLTDFRVEDLHPVQTAGIGNGFKITPGLGCVVRRGDLDGMYGTVMAYAVTIGDDAGSANTASGRVDEITVSRIHCRPGSGYQLLNLGCTNGGRFLVDRCSYNASANANNGIIHVVAGSVIAALTVRDLTVVAAAANCCPIRNDGTISDLLVAGVTGVLGGKVVWNQGASATASISRVTFTGIHTSGHGLVDSYNAGNTLGSIQATNCDMTGLTSLFDLATTTEVHLTNVTTANGSVVTCRATAAVRLVANACKFGGGITQIGGPGGIASGSFGWAVDVSTLTTTTLGDMANNTNSALSCGVGPVVYNGSAWVGLQPRDTDIVLSAPEMSSMIGSPSLSTLGSVVAAWLLDPASTESIGASLGAKEFLNWTTFDVVARVANATTDTGDHVLRFHYRNIALAATVNAVTSATAVTTTALAQYITQEVTLASGLAVPPAGSHFQFRLDRVGGDAADTKAGDLAVLQLYLRRAS